MQLMKRMGVVMRYLHVLATRFNLRNDLATKDKNQNETLSPEWYAERFRLFDDICYPSVRNQVGKDFKWYIFFDISTPDAYLEKIRGYGCASPEIRIVFIDGKKEFRRKMNEIIESRISGHDWLVTSRLDNDDGLGEDFTSLIAEYARTVSGPTVIDFTRGYLLDREGDRDLVRRKTDYFGPFISLVEPVAGFKTVFHMKHRHWKKAWQGGETGLVRNSKDFMWVQTIHNRNLKNRMKSEEFLSPKKALQKFNVDLTSLNTEYGLLFQLMDSLKVAFIKTIKVHEHLRHLRESRGP